MTCPKFGIMKSPTQLLILNMKRFHIFSLAYPQNATAMVVPMTLVSLASVLSFSLGFLRQECSYNTPELHVILQ